MATSPWKTTSQKSKFICHIGALLAVVMWGASFVSTKVLVNNGLGPVEIYIYRFIMAYALVLIACHKKLFANNWRDELLFAVCGLCGGSIYFIAENNAVNYTRVSDVSMITTLAPLITTLLIGLLYRSERPGKWTYISSVIAFFGVGCIVFKDGLSKAEATSGPDELSTTIGDLLALGAAFSWAIYSVVLRKLNVTYSAQFITRKTFFYGLVTALPFWFLSPEPLTPVSVLLKPEVIGNLLFLGLICSMLAYLLWAAVMSRLGAIVTNNYLYVQPIATMIIAAILFPDDPITIMGCFGATLIIGGLWLGDYMTARATRNS
ncbi:MAG: DMT family transporter [Bacteroidales bacterium]|nr:DMT family transporter [Bacteroidales bacterium]